MTGATVLRVGDLIVTPFRVYAIVGREGAQWAAAGFFYGRDGSRFYVKHDSITTRKRWLEHVKVFR